MTVFRSLWTVAVLGALLLSGCRPVQAPAADTGAAGDAPAAASTSTALPTTPEAGAPAGAFNEVTVTAVEYSFDLPESLPAGWTRFTLDNQGEQDHDFTLIKLAEGKTLDDVQAALAAEGPPDWAEFYGLAAAKAGASNWFAAYLTPGNYAYVSFGGGETGPDAAQGMLGTLIVTGESTANTDPLDADVSVDLVDYQFVVDGSFASGDQVMRVTNSGTELHEITFFKLKEGKTVDDFMAALAREMSGEPVPEDDIPGEFLGGTYLSPGRTAFAPQALEPGEYLLVCFVPSPKNEMKAHAQLGMIQQITVD